MSSIRTKRRALDIWPAFVDATASLLMVVVFVLMIATVGQLFLSTALSSKDSALGKLNAQVAELADELSLAKTNSDELGALLEVRTASLAVSESNLSASEEQRLSQATKLQKSEAREAALNREFNAQADALGSLQNEVAGLMAARDRIKAELTRTLTERDDVRAQLTQETDISLARLAQTELLNQQLSEVRKQLEGLNRTLEVMEEEGALKSAQIEDLGARLNLALASKAQQLEKYRSAFFGRLREVIADYPGVQIVGDRFVLPAELLFESGSDELDKRGYQQIEELAKSLVELSERIPADVDWVLRVDGHTDAQAIQTERFPSNWELSAARAIRIVRALSQLGIPQARLAATGFAEHHPIDPDETKEAYARNRRIEIKLTSR